MQPFVRNELEALVVEHLKWTSREASMATMFMLQTALQKANIALPEVSPEVSPHVSPQTTSRDVERPSEKLKLHVNAQAESKESENGKEKEIDFGLAVSSFGPSLKTQLLPSMATTLDNFDPLFKKVQSRLSELSQIKSLKKAHETDDPPYPERNPRNLALEVAELQKEITHAAETLQRRKVVYLIMRHDNTGVFTDKHVELFERMLERNERDAECLRERLRVTSATLHDATRVLQASGDRLYSLDLLDKEALSEWNKFAQDMNEF